ACNLIPGNCILPGDQNNTIDVFVRDRDFDGNGIFDEAGASKQTTVRVSVAGDGTQGNDGGHGAQISGDGRFVGFTSLSNFLCLGVCDPTNDTNNVNDAYVHDRDFDGNGVFDETGTGRQNTVRVSVFTDGSQTPNGGALLGLSRDARFVLFRSD